MKDKPRGKPVRIAKDELIVDDDAEDLFSKMVRGCTGEITINSPLLGKHTFRKNKSNKRIRRVKPAKA